ncbi:Hypothetical predicted protein [Pelobates cultripes]|uniref:Uncharacterized protein n=1 Tax=Pelobates cultripes TaxID=61616 RepID=A0AAD1SY99_PELCU|nr:Hypothetical predicted protein [Pelobates cultripes]
MRQLESSSDVSMATEAHMQSRNPPTGGSSQWGAAGVTSCLFLVGELSLISVRCTLSGLTLGLTERVSEGLASWDCTQHCLTAQGGWQAVPTGNHHHNNHSQGVSETMGANTTWKECDNC